MTYKIIGGRRLEGVVDIGGAKNSVLELMAAALLTREPVVLHNVPTLSDVECLAGLLRQLGATVEWSYDTHTMRICAASITSVRAPFEAVSKMRASIYVLGALLGREGRAEVAMPGGCKIGARPIDIHLRSFEALGASVLISDDYIIASGKLSGAEIDGRVSTEPLLTSHGGTVNAILAAALADGTSRISYASNEPEVDDLVGLVNAMGGSIWRDGSDIVIDGAATLHGCEYSVMPDRLEVGTYAALAVATRGRVNINNCDWHKLELPLDLIRRAGAEVWVSQTGIVVDGSLAEEGLARLCPLDIEVAQYPLFPTDLQSQFMAMLAVADGDSSIKETLFENRLMYVPELVKMGAKAEVLSPSEAVFHGVERLHGTSGLQISDMRAGAALTIAALGAEGVSVLDGTHYIDRGYQDFVKNLCSLGAAVEEV